ncbi:hypothetical protein Taro_035792 [Colocasia esculenta]|uniref:SIS domain-containing protein n=1 Tax=Colocasia esculenta TaxID=4460 RepID=A0A843W6P0_COLES|nr:hypothetical protein [Colocasia esculenta]
MSSGGDPAASAMATQICDQIRSIFSAPPSPYGSPLEVLVEEIAASAGRGNRVFVHGVGREGLMLRAFCMRLYHLGVAAHPVGDVTTPPAAPGDLLLASAGPGGFSTVGAICGVARAAGARVVLLTAQPESGSEARRCADRVAFLPAQTMADAEDEEAVGDNGEGKESGGPSVRLPMGSLYEGAAFVLFEMVVCRLEVVLGCTPQEMRSRHTNLE